MITPKLMLKNNFIYKFIVATCVCVGCICVYILYIQYKRAFLASHVVRQLNLTIQKNNSEQFINKMLPKQTKCVINAGAGTSNKKSLCTPKNLVALYETGKMYTEPSLTTKEHLNEWFYKSLGGSKLVLTRVFFVKSNILHVFYTNKQKDTIYAFVILLDKNSWHIKSVFFDANRYVDIKQSSNPLAPRSHNKNFILDMWDRAIEYSFYRLYIIITNTL